MRALRVFVALSAILLALSLATCWYHGLRGPKDMGFQLFNLPSRAFDYWDYLPRFPYRHSARFFTYNGIPGYEFYYPAPAIFLLAPFYHFDRSFPLTTVPLMIRGTYRLRGYQIYVFVGVSIFLTMAAMVATALRRRGVSGRDIAIVVIGTVLTAHPMFFALQRGNIEALAWMISAVAVWAFVSDRRNTAAVLIGAAGAVKLYPLLLAGLFLRERNFRALFLSIATWVAVTLGGLYYLDPSLHESLNFVLTGVSDWTKANALAFEGLYEHSAFGLVKWITFSFHPQYARELSFYYPVAALCALGLFAGAMRQSFVNQVVFLCCAAVTLPPSSYDYTLCLLYVPLTLVALGIAAQQAPRHAKIQTLVLVLFAVILSPELFLNFGSMGGNAGALKAVCLILLMVISAVAPIVAGEPRSMLADAVPSDHPVSPQLTGAI